MKTCTSFLELRTGGKNCLAGFEAGLHMKISLAAIVFGEASRDKSGICLTTGFRLPRDAPRYASRNENPWHIGRHKSLSVWRTRYTGPYVGPGGPFSSFFLALFLHFTVRRNGSYTPDTPRPSRTSRRIPLRLASDLSGSSHTFAR